MNKDIIEKLFPDALRRIEAGRCPICAEIIKAEEFRTELDVKEHKISGLCQLCISKTFKNTKKIIVLAGNYRQFRDYISGNLEFPPEKYVYGEFPEKMLGIEAERIDIVGTFWHRKDAEKLKEIAKSRLR